MRSHINDELPATMAALVTQGVDEITGAQYSQAAVYSLLLKLETYMRREMEAQSESLANFYLKAFNRILETEGLFQLLHSKGYGQGYIDDLGIYQALEAAQKEVHANVRVRLPLVPAVRAAAAAGAPDRHRSEVPGELEHLVGDHRRADCAATAGGSV